MMLKYDLFFINIAFAIPEKHVYMNIEQSELLTWFHYTMASTMIWF